MYFLNKFCCVCLNRTENLKLLFEEDFDGVTYHDKLTSSVAEMCFDEMNDQRLICGECCVTLNTVYSFRQTCLRSKTNLITYVSQLQTFGKVSGTLNVRLVDIYKEVILKKEIKTEASEKSDQENEIHCDIMDFEISIKEEECENEGYFETEKYSNDENVIEKTYCDIKIEEDFRTRIEDDFTEQFEQVYVPCEIVNTEMDIEENMFMGVKEESFIETIQDGSTSKESNNTNKENSIECEICNKHFTYNCELKRHLRIHPGVKPYQCKICSKKFMQNSDLKRHIKIHSGERPYECKLCWRKFVQNSDLTIHSRIHSGVRPYECTTCSKKFIKKSDLTRHIRIHSSERPYMCEICKKSFTHPKNLKDHMRTHTGVRPFECNICKKTFTKNSDLTRHVKTHDIGPQSEAL